MLLPDEHCPECHGTPEIQHTFRGGVRKRCTECRHTWREEVKVPLTFTGGWVEGLEEERDDDDRDQ